MIETFARLATDPMLQAARLPEPELFAWLAAAALALSTMAAVFLFATERRAARRGAVRKRPLPSAA